MLPKPSPDDDRLATFLGQNRAAHIRRELDKRNRVIKAEGDWTASGYTDARLCTVLIMDASGAPRPQRRIAKLCPPGPDRHESKGHYQAVKFDEDFAAKHFVKQVEAPITCPDNWTVIFLEIAGGTLRSRRLSELPTELLGDACAAIHDALLDEWASDKVEYCDEASVSDLLAHELGSSIEPKDWLHNWAQARGLLELACDWIELGDGILCPNPFALVRKDSFASRTDCPYLTGPCHGDLHGDNILFPPPSRGKPFDPSAFQLIDLATFEEKAPLSRDIATLTVATLARLVGPPADTKTDALITYIVDVAGHTTPRPATDLAAIVDELTDMRRIPAAIVATGLDDRWHNQLKVSLLAQSMRHCAYESIGQNGRWWCLRLAAHLARELLMPRGMQLDPTSLRSLRPEICAPADTWVSARAPGAISQAYKAKRSSIVDRDEEFRLLAEALHTETSGIVVVYGLAGMGKTDLVEEALRAVRDRTVHHHEATWVSGVAVKTLVDDLMNGESRHWRGEKPLLRLRAAVEALRGGVVIVIEAAENLLDDKGRIRDESLDEALDFLSTVDKQQVTVVLVSRRDPESRCLWPSTACKIQIQPLPSEFFAELLSRRSRRWADLPPTDLERLCHMLGGNPRHAVLLGQIGVMGEFLPSQAADRLSRVPAEEVHHVLADTLMRGLPEAQCWVICALAAFGTPVPADAVSELLEGKVDQQRVDTALRQLTDIQLVRLDATEELRYSVATPDIEPVLTNLPADDKGKDNARTRFLLDAALVLHHHATPIAEANGITDLHFWFAVVSILLRARMYGEAHEFMEKMDKVLRRWNRGELLREQRERVQGKLGGDHFAEMENDNALADIYVTQGEIVLAQATFERALRAQLAEGAFRERPKIQINWAGLHWECNETAQAEKLYRKALAMAQEFGDDEDQVLAYEGLADCHRRYGRYADAIRSATRAFNIADARHISRAAVVALKSARWHAELGQLAGSLRLIELAQDVADRHGDESLWSACLDARADYWLYAGKDGSKQAVKFARQAINIALEQGDPVILLQARTTLCFAYLLQDNLSDATREIESAAGYRRPLRSLLVLALQALVQREARTGETNTLFDTLAKEARRRQNANTADFAAWDFEGIALCGQARPGESLEPVLRAFATARSMTSPVPGLVGRLAVIVNRIARRDVEPARFRPVLDLLDSTLSHPGN